MSNIHQTKPQTPHRLRKTLLLAAFLTVGLSVQGRVPAIAQTTIAQKLPGAGTVQPVPIPIGKPIGIGSPITRPAAGATCCPPMDTKVFGTFFKRIESGNITSPYELKFDPVGLGLGTQYTAMLNAYQSYYNLLKYLSNGQITDLTIGVYLSNGTDNGVDSAGNPNLPTPVSPPIGQAFINFSNGPIAQPPMNSFFTPVLQPNRWYGINGYSYTNVGFNNPQQAGFAPSCNKPIQTWVRWQVMNGRLMRQTINDGKLESVDVKAVSAK
jgi:hypothetical protein